MITIIFVGFICFLSGLALGIFIMAHEEDAETRRLREADEQARQWLHGGRG